MFEIIIGSLYNPSAGFHKGDCDQLRNKLKFEIPVPSFHSRDIEIQISYLNSASVARLK